jgi:hypothetical protein
MLLIIMVCLIVVLAIIKWYDSCHLYDSLQYISISLVFELSDTSQEGNSRPVRRGVSKGEEDGRKLSALWVGHPPNGHGVGRPKGVFGVLSCY